MILSYFFLISNKFRVFKFIFYDIYLNIYKIIIQKIIIKMSDLKYNINEFKSKLEKSMNKTKGLISEKKYDGILNNGRYSCKIEFLILMLKNSR